MDPTLSVTLFLADSSPATVPVPGIPVVSQPGSATQASTADVGLIVGLTVKNEEV
jgi:hypothetical protein